MEKVIKSIFVVILFVITLILQLFLFDNFSLFGVKPNMIIISVILVALNSSIYFSTTYSFVLGIIVDLLFGTSGMFTISYTVLGMILGFVNDDYMKGNYFTLIILTAISVCLFETILYIQSMIRINEYVSFFILIRQLILSIILNTIIIVCIYAIYNKIMKAIDKKQNRLYW